MYSKKGKFSTWLLWSLIPNGIVGFFTFILSINYVGGEDSVLWTITTTLMVLSWISWWLSLLVGIILKLLAGMDTRRSYKESRQYADLHGWQPLSDVAWKNFKRRGVTFSVQPAFEQPTFLLLIDLDGEVISTEGFSKSLYALRFADHLWDHILEDSQTITKAAVVQERQQWEQTQALAIRR